MARRLCDPERMRVPGGCVFRGGCVRGSVSGNECGGGCVPAEMRGELFGGEVSGGGVGRRVPTGMRGGIFCSAAYCRRAGPAPA